MNRRIAAFAVVATLAHAVSLLAWGQVSSPVPRTWDDEAMATLEVPLATPEFSPRHVTADYYYRMAVRPIYKTYPVYPPDKEPAGYVEWLRQQEPEIVFDPAALRTEADWIAAGELVFDAPAVFESIATSPVRYPEFYARSGVRLAADGSMPFKRYVVRKKGVVEAGDLSCGQCHTRVMDDGRVVKGAQGNFAEGFYFAARPRRALQNGQPPEVVLSRTREAARRIYGAPWIQPPPEGGPELPLETILAAWEATPPGVGLREGTSLRYPAQVPDLIGVKERRYLDHTGLVRHRSIGDLMRYAALNQNVQQFSSYGEFIPGGRQFRELPDPAARFRYSDEQLYALAQFIYSLKPPPNPNPFDERARRGQAVFERSGCATCHTPPLYTNNKLTPVEGFVVPAGHAARFDIMPVVVGTDTNSALRTRRGTGYYKVPSLKGVWYRGPFEHNGSVATLDEWFDPARAVKGHRFGLSLSAEDRKALIAFLKTL
jgi:cytochrome c2